MADTFSLRGKLGLDAREFQRSADKAADSLDDLDDKLEEDREITVDTSSAEANLQGLGESGTGIGDMLGSGIASGFAAVGVGGLLAAGLNEAMNIEKGVDRVTGQFALTADEAEKFGKMGGDLYADAWGESVEEATRAIALVDQQLVDTGHASEDALDGIAERALALADAFGEDLDAVIRSVSQLMLNGLAPDAEAALDMVTVAFQEGGNKAGDLLDTIDEYSQHWAAMGIDGNEALGLIVTGFQDGQRDADKLADAIKEMSIRAVEDTATVSDAYASLGLDADAMRTAFLEGGDAARNAFETVITALRDVEDPVEQQRLAVELIGTQYEDLGRTALDTLSTVGDGLGETEGAAEDLAETVSDNAAASFEELKREAMQGVAETLTPVLELGVALKEIADLDFSSAGQSFQSAFSDPFEGGGFGNLLGPGGGSIASFALDQVVGLFDSVTGGADEATAAVSEFYLNPDVLAYEAATRQAATADREAATARRRNAEATRLAGQAAVENATNVRDFAGASREAGGAVDVWTSSYSTLRDRIGEASTQYQTLFEQMTGSVDAGVRAEQQTRQLGEAVDAAKESTKGMDEETRNSRDSMSEWTDEELAAYDQALDTAQAIADQKGKQQELNGVAQTAERKAKNYRQALREVSSQLDGPMKSALDTFRSNLRDIPNRIDVNIHTTYTSSGTRPAELPGVVPGSASSSVSTSGGGGGSGGGGSTQYNSSNVVVNNGTRPTTVGDLDRAFARANIGQG